MVCRLLRSFYGLKKPALGTSKSPLSSSNAFSLYRHPCLYIDLHWGRQFIVAKDGRDKANVKAQLAREFEMKDVDRSRHFLGMKIGRTNGGISID
jgi:hypothetical protein